MPRKSKPAAAARPVRAWVQCNGVLGPLVALRQFRRGHGNWNRMPLHGGKIAASMPVLILDPRTHRAVAIKKPKRKDRP